MFLECYLFYEYASYTTEQIHNKLFHNHTNDHNTVVANVTPQQDKDTGFHVQKEYTSLGISCPNAYTKSFC